MDMDALFTLHEGLRRCGPGSDAATRQAIDRLPELPPSPTVVDMGCGPGRHTVILARELGCPVTGVDVHEPFLEQLRRLAAEEGVSHLVSTHVGSMMEPEEKPGSVDLIWAEGAIYIAGFAEGLRLWRPLLKDGGLIVASELTWLTPYRVMEAEEFWEEGYPAMTDIVGNVAHAEAQGFQVLDHFTLSSVDWWTDYYGPLRDRIAQLRPTADAALSAVMDETVHEMDVHARFGDSYSYVFYLMRKTAGKR